jgi:chitin disaccharide deacetylase
MTASPAWRDAVEMTKGIGMGLGCHVVLVDGVPVLPPSEISSLVDPHNPEQFRPSLGQFTYDLLRGRILEAHIEAEAAAQIGRLRQMGPVPTHLDTHKHTHVFPRVLRPLLRAALMCGVRCIRNPFEPRWCTSAAPGESMVRRLQIMVLRSQHAYFLKAMAASGLLTTDGAIGIAATGSLDAPALRILLAAMPDGTWELVCHPGYVDPALKSAHTRLIESRELERLALLEAIPAAAERGLRLIHFGQLDPGGE